MLNEPLTRYARTGTATAKSIFVAFRIQRIRNVNSAEILSPIDCEAWKCRIAPRSGDAGVHGNLLYVWRQISKLTLPKSEYARRHVDVGPQVLRALSEHRRNCPRTDKNLVFPSQSDRPVHASDWNRDVFKPTTRRALLPNLTLHDLRHTYASALIHQRQSVKYVQTVMGHASAETTLNVYGHLFEVGGQDAARQLEAWFVKGDTDRPQALAGWPGDVSCHPMPSPGLLCIGETPH